MPESEGPKEYNFPQYPYADFNQTASETYYLLGLVTSESALGKSGDRPLSLRQKRAEMYGEVQEARRSGNKDLAVNINAAGNLGAAGNSQMLIELEYRLHPIIS